MSDLNKVHGIITYYQNKYREKYGKTSIINRNKVQYFLANILRDLSVREIKQLIDFYIKTDKTPSLARFCYEYDELYERMTEETRDLENRKNLLSQTQKAVEEFRRRYGAG